MTRTPPSRGNPPPHHRAHPATRHTTTPRQVTRTGTLPPPSRAPRHTRTPGDTPHTHATPVTTTVWGGSANAASSGWRVSVWMSTLGVVEVCEPL